MTAYAVDACALIAYLFDEEGSGLFEDLLLRARNKKLEITMHYANLGEVYYDIVKRNNTTIAMETYQDIKLLPIRFEDRISDRMIHKIGEIKTAYRISYADSFAVAHTILTNAELLTTDHKEFDPLERDNIVPIKWLR